MTMHRRPVGRSRVLAALGAIITLVGCFLPWFKVGGGSDQLTTITGTGFEGTGIIVFAHGSRVESANQAVRATAAELARA